MFSEISIENKVKLFSDMVLCCHELYYTVYSDDQRILFQNAPEQLPINMLFYDSADWEHLDLLATEDSHPILLSSQNGISWLIIPLPSDHCVHVLGPFFLSDISAKNIELGLDERNFSLAAKRQVMSILQKLPVISINRILEYAIMLHYCLFKEKITIDSISFLGSHTAQSVPRKIFSDTVNHGTYEAEQEMLRMVREGDLNYRSHMNKIAVTGTLGNLSNGDPIRQIKNSILVATTLFSRAAIEGGLDPEISYTLTDYYFQSVESCNAISDLADIMHTMQNDFIQRVHSCRLSTEYSAPIRSCIEYINYHLEEPVNLKQLIHSLGYNDCYFSKKFKKETGWSPKDYLLEQRFERAKFLLKNSSKSVSDISAQLHFCSQSYFTEQFKKRYHVTPAEYRNIHTMQSYRTNSE